MLKRVLFSIIVMLGLIAPVFADSNDVSEFFNRYVNAANTYSDSVQGFYASNAKIVRVVIKKDGTKQSVVTDTKTYMKQLQMNAKIAKIRSYKNYYSNKTITPVGSDYKVSVMRKPSTSDYKLPAYFIIGKDSSGKLKIKEESMHTYQTAILIGAEKKK